VGACGGARQGVPTPAHAGWPPGVGVDHEQERRRDLISVVRDRQSLRLPNGVSVILEVRPGLPVVTAALSFPGVPGSRSEAIAAAAARITSSAHSALNGGTQSYGGMSWNEFNPDETTYFVSGGA